MEIWISSLCDIPKVFDDGSEVEGRVLHTVDDKLRVRARELGFGRGLGVGRLNVSAQCAGCCGDADGAEQRAIPVVDGIGQGIGLSVDSREAGEYRVHVPFGEGRGDRGDGGDKEDSGV